MSLCSVQQAARARGIWRGISLSQRLMFGLSAKKEDLRTLVFTLTSQLTDIQQIIFRLSRTTSPTACKTWHMIQEEFLERLTLKLKAIRSFDLPKDKTRYSRTEWPTAPLWEPQMSHLWWCQQPLWHKLRIFKQYRQRTYNVTFRCVRVTTGVIERQ